MGGSLTSEWLAGAVAPEGSGTIPNITSGPGGIGDWSEGDIVTALKDGFKPDFDTLGGAMVDVQQNLALLPDADRAAIAAYLKAVPPHENGYPAKPAPASN
jgi:mono/diheme cytochrome c family protein